MTTPFTSFATRYREAFDWLRSECKGAVSSRFSMYKKELDARVEAERSGALQTHLQNRGPHFLNAYYEANFLISISEGMKGKSIRIPPDKLDLIVKGPEVRTKETPTSNKARNTLYEVFKFIELKDKGFDVEYGSQADLVVNIDGIKLAIECKRPLKKTSLETSIRDAHKQIRKNASVEYGLFFIESGRVLNSTSGYLEYRSEERRDADMDKLARLFTKEHETNWQKFMKTKTIGGLFEFCIPTEITEGDKSGLSFYHDKTLVNSCVPGSKEFELLMHFDESIGTKA